jgi:hypothetical protein
MLEDDQTVAPDLAMAVGNADRQIEWRPSVPLVRTFG